MQVLQVLTVMTIMMIIVISSYVGMITVKYPNSKISRLIDLSRVTHDLPCGKVTEMYMKIKYQ